MEKAEAVVKDEDDEDATGSAPPSDLEGTTVEGLGIGFRM